MPAPDLFMKQGDLLPELTATLEDALGVVNLTGASVVFTMRPVGSTTPKVNGSASIISAPDGTVKYTWSGTDTDTVGDYHGEFEATFGIKKMTFPNDRHLFIRIVDDLA